MRIQFKDFNSTEFKRVKIVRYKQNSEEKGIVMKYKLIIQRKKVIIARRKLSFHTHVSFSSQHLKLSSDLDSKVRDLKMNSIISHHMI